MTRCEEISLLEQVRVSRRTPLLPGMVFLLTASLAQADYQDGLDAYNTGDFTTAMAEWKKEVNRPDPPESLAIYRESLYGIATLYWKGQGVEKDYTIASVWLKQAADINHAGAQVKLGFLYSTGQGVPQNFEEAERWFRMAADKGDEDAIHNLNVLQERGLLTTPAEVTGIPMADAGELPTSPPPEKPALKAAAEPSANLVPAKAGSDSGEKWILDRNPEHYTIQIIALSHPEKLHDFIERNKVWAPFAIYRQTRYEQPLWVLVQGDYADVEVAREAIRVFPSGLQKPEELWIRRFRMVQGLIE